VKKVEDKLVAELRKHLPVADPKLTPGFLEEVKAHYEKFDEPEMLQEKLYMLATSAMPPKMMVKWLQRWNSSAAIRSAHRFPKVGFADSKFPEWLNRATWWAQVSIYLDFHFYFPGTNELDSGWVVLFFLEFLANDILHGCKHHFFCSYLC
jgi:hypothetical protein